MKSPGIEWTLGAGYLALLDYIRARGEADGDTASECIRDLIAKHPHGQLLFTGALIAGGVAFHRHITKPLNRTPKHAKRAAF